MKLIIATAIILSSATASFAGSKRSHLVHIHNHLGQGHEGHAHHRKDDEPEPEVEVDPTPTVKSAPGPQGEESCVWIPETAKCVVPD